MAKNTTTLASIIREYKEYLAIEEQLKAEMESLKTQAIEILSAEEIDEFTCDEGKVTYREVISNRFASSAFKKVHADLYRAFTAQTASMRFTCN